MSQRVNPKLKKDLSKFGVKDWNECFHCGNCTATCQLTENGALFPRKTIRQAQMGLSGSLASNIDPWLCYYCGDCSETCPRDANPGELMMSLRRYLSTKYDWTGLSSLFYKYMTAFIIGLVLVAAGIIGYMMYAELDQAELMEFGHKFELYSIIGVFSLIIFPNIIRMFWFTIIKGKIKAPFFSYISGFFSFIIHMITQKDALRCDNNTFRWLAHFLVVGGYLALLFTTVFLNWFGTDNQTIVITGYAVGALVFVFSLVFIFARIGKKKEITRFSHPTDWFFIIWLFLMGISAVVVRGLIDYELLSENFWVYIAHLIILAQWAILIVPFGKWMHFMYRLFGLYFAGLRKASLKELKTNPAFAAA